MTYAPLAVDVTGWLIARLDAALTVRVGSKTPSDLADELPFVRVERAGGPDDRVILDMPTMEFHCFAADQPTANQVGYEVIRAVYDLRGVATAGAVVTRAQKMSGPFWAEVTDPKLAHAVVLMQTRIKTTGQ